MVSKAMFINDQGLGRSSAPVALDGPRAEEVLEELFVLLEEFGPQWYTEELHDRAVAALQIG